MADQDPFRRQRAGERPTDPSRKVREGRPRRRVGEVRSLGEIAGDDPTKVRDFEQQNREFLQLFKPKSNLPAGVDQSPKGDLGKHSAMELMKVFHRKIKGGGKPDHASSYLPFHPESMQGDSPGIRVRQHTPDKVV